MFTQWNQIEDWIKDAGFKHWIFYVNNPDKRADGDRSNDKILDSKFFAGDTDQKLELTRKMLEAFGKRCYGVAYQSDTATTGGCWCEVDLSGAGQQQSMMQQMIQQMPASGVGTVDEAALTAKIRKEILTEMKAEKLEADRKALDAERREFQREKNSAIGLLVGYLKPVFDAKVAGLIPGSGQQPMRNVAGLIPGQQPMRNVAGVDSDEDVEASRIVAPEQEAEVVEEDFSDEEAQKLNDLMVRFKKVEPQYLELIEVVVAMAEYGDSIYTMAKGVLLANK